MKTLADALQWYRVTKQSLTRMRRIGSAHWNQLSRQAVTLWEDDEFKTLESADIVNETTASLKPIDDLAVVVLFSVFESRVRDYLAARMKPESEALLDPILKEAADAALQGVREGSFFGRVLNPLKAQDRITADLITQIDQVRHYRNWVAHGRRDAPTNNVTPQMAYDRLAKFLTVLGIAVESEGPEEKE